MTDTPLDPVPTPLMTLEDAVTTPEASFAAPPEHVPHEEPVQPLTTEQIVGVVALVSKSGLPPDVGEAYKQDLENNQSLKQILDMVGLADALAEYGIGAAGGRLPPWASLILGVGALGYTIWSTRQKYANSHQGASGGLGGFTDWHADGPGGLDSKKPTAAG